MAGLTQRLVDRTWIAVFLGFLIIPGLGTALKIATGPTQDRYERMAPTPSLAPDRVKAFPLSFLRYFRARFALKHELHELDGSWVYGVLGGSLVPSVTLGKSPWLFLGKQPALWYHRGLEPEAVDPWVDLVVSHHRMLEARGIPYLVVLAPIKHTIMDDELRPPLRARGRTRGDAFVERLVEAGVPVVDLRPTIAAAAATTRVYHHTDTHWNSVGAWVASQEILRRIETLLPSLTAPDKELGEIEIVTSTRTAGDLARIIGRQEAFVEVDQQVRPGPPTMLDPDGHPVVLDTMDLEIVPELRVHVPMSDTTRPGRLLVLRDSFGTALVPWLAPYFEEALYVWRYHLSDTLVSAEQPAIVVQEIVERKLMVGVDQLD